MMKFVYYIMFFLLISSSCNQITYSSTEVKECLDSLLPDEREYFHKIAYLDYEYLRKWDQDIYVSVVGNNIRDGDQQTIDELIAEVSILINPLKISRTNDNNANLVFKLESDLPNSNHAYGQALPRYKRFDNSVLDYADILIFPTSNGYARKRTMYHEMMHALGMNHPKRENGQVVFYDSRISPYNLTSYEEADHEKYLSENYKFSNMDKKIIRAIYSPCMPKGISKKEMEKIIF